MKQNYFLLLLFFSQLFVSQIINFPDAKFKARLLQSTNNNQIAGGQKIDLNNDGEIDINEAKNITKISINNEFGFPYLSDSYPSIGYNISSLEGINYFTNLKVLECKGNNLSVMDFKNLVDLEQIYCQGNKITSFSNFEDVNKLYVFNCSDNLLSNLNLSKAAKNVLSNNPNYNNKGHVMYKYDRNPVINLNIQTGFKTIWRLLINDWSYCPFGNSMVNNCYNFPEPIPTLVNITLNCVDVGEISFGNTVTVTDDCLIATDETSKAKMSVSPNPARDYLKIDFTGKVDKIEIYDETGRLILSPAINQNRINISKLKSGVYFLNVLINGERLSSKFVKQ